MKCFYLFIFLVGLPSYSSKARALDQEPPENKIEKESEVLDEKEATAILQTSVPGDKEKKVEQEEDKLKNCDEINILWQKKFHKDFKVNWPVSAFHCSSQWMLLPSSIFFIYKNHWIINNKIVDLYSWLTKDLLLLDYERENQQFRGAFGTAHYGKITLYQTYFEHRDHSVIGANMLIHEHRHNKKNDPLHQICQWGIYKGQLACDFYFNPWGEHAGSYSYEVGFLKAVRQSNQAPFIKEIARAWEKSRTYNNFNGYPSQMDWEIK